MFELKSSTPHHDPYGLYRRLIEARAQGLCDALVKRLIRKCQKHPVGLLGNAGLKNLWEEICIAIRNDHPMKSLYEAHLQNHLNDLVMALPAIDQQTLWLVTYPGTEYATSPEWPHAMELVQKNLPLDTKPNLPWPSITPSDWPWDTRRIAIEIINDSVLEECFNYENAQIRAYEGR